MTTTTHAWTDALAHLLAVAAQLEREGQYNVAKLTRAAADSLVRRAAFALPMPSDLPALAAHVHQAASAVQSLSGDEMLAAAMRVGAEAMAGGRLTTISETPNPWVCRTCGYATLVQPATPCPTCDAWPETFQQFLPVYWLNDLEPFAAIARLRQTPQHIASLIAQAPDAVLDRKPEPGGWSVQQALGHLRDAQGVLAQRITLILEHDNPELAALAVFEWADAEDERLPSARQLFALYMDGREKLLARLEALPLAAWWRTGRHEEFGVVSLRQQVSYFAAHESTHLAQIQRLVHTIPA